MDYWLKKQTLHKLYHINADLAEMLGDLQKSYSWLQYFHKRNTFSYDIVWLANQLT